jgi:putative CocE/NonD family hydrolase
MYFSRHGLPFLIVNVRGRGDSEGVFWPGIQEANDGHDVVEWVARQQYCNGKVSMFGGSYLGHAQWATAKEFPAHLATIVPTAAPYLGVDFPMRNNIFNPYIVQWLTLISGHAVQKVIFHDMAMWSDIYRRWYDSGRPFRQLDAIAGHPSAIFQEWLDHPQPDAYWDERNPTDEEYARIELPILTITGSYDDDQPGALEHYRRHMRLGSATARSRHYLVIGPWDHGGTGTPRAEFGGIKCGPTSLLDINKLHLAWYAWAMQDGPKPEFLMKSVVYYVMGSERWRYAESLDAITLRHEPLFLDSNGNAHDLYSSGSLSARPGEGQPDAYTFNPAETGCPEVEAEAGAAVGSLVDQTVLHALHSKALVYHSAPFVADTEISGFFKLCAWIAIDCPDTDIYVTLYEIGLDGGSIRLSTDAIRARYREGLRTPKLVATRDPLRYDFERFTFVSRRVKRGHRLRLVISPIGRLIETIFSEKNYNGGGVVAQESSGEAKTVTMKLFHDRAHPSVLNVPIGRPESPQEPEAPASAFASLLKVVR